MNDAFGSPHSVLVLGGTSDIALATVRRLTADRCRTVVLAGRDLAALEGAAKEFVDDGVAVEVVAFDAEDTGSHEGFVADVFARHPDIDAVLLAFGVLGDQELADYLLDEAHVAVIPGSVFEAPGHLRISYAAGRDEIVEAIDRIREALGKIGA